MGERYSVLRDLSGARTASPFEMALRAELAAARGLAVGAEPHVDAVELSKREVRDMVRDHEVRAVAPVMPTSLVHPIKDATGERAEAEARAAAA